MDFISKDVEFKHLAAQRNEIVLNFCTLAAVLVLTLCLSSVLSILRETTTQISATGYNEPKFIFTEMT